MLGFLRGASKGWLAKLLIGLLVISFAVWGVSGSIIYGQQTTVAEVGDTRVDVTDFRFAYDGQLSLLSQQLQRRLSPQEANAFGLTQMVTEQLVTRAVLDETSRKMGLGVSSEQLAAAIAEDPTFRNFSGEFSRDALRASLRRSGINEEYYIDSRKSAALRNQFQAGTIGSFSSPDAYKNALLQYQGETRVLEYIKIGSESVDPVQEPDDNSVQTFYDENNGLFVAPEYRKVSVIILQGSDLAKPSEISADEVRNEYESQIDSYKTPERRRIAQLVLKDEAEADLVSKRIADGDGFDVIVSELGKKEADLDLGLLTKAELPDEKIANAAFSAQLNKPTAPIAGVFGPVILLVTEIQPEATRPFEEVEQQLRDNIALREAGDRVFEIFDAVEEERTAGEQLPKIAELLSLDNRVIESIDARGLDEQGNAVTGVPNLGAFTQAVFESEKGDDNRRALEIGSDGFIWYEVMDIVPERLKPLEEVREDAIGAWKRSQTNRNIETLANSIADKLRSGGDFEAVLASSLPTDSFGQAVKPEKSQAVSRSDTQVNVPREVIQAGFGVAGNGIAATPVGTEEFAIVKVLGINTSTAEELSEQDGLRADLLSEQDMVSQIIGDLRSRENVTVNQAAINNALAPGH